jgi:peroxiredoxin
MEGHQRNLYLYERFNTRVAGVSRDDITTLKYWAEDLSLTFPLLSNVTGYLGSAAGVQEGGSAVFARRTIIVDKKGLIRYAKNGSPDFKEIAAFLKELHAEEDQK